MKNVQNFVGDSNLDWLSVQSVGFGWVDWTESQSYSDSSLKLLIIHASSNVREWETRLWYVYFEIRWISSFPVILGVYDDPLGFVHAKFVGAQLQSICEWKRQVKGQLPFCCFVVFVYRAKWVQSRAVTLLFFSYNGGLSHFLRPQILTHMELIGLLFL